jgi:hypothetical protein
MKSFPKMIWQIITLPFDLLKLQKELRKSMMGLIKETNHGINDEEVKKKYTEIVTSASELIKKDTP